jgi:hypothetical protein
MSGDEGARRQLQERLLDDVGLPPDAVREAMFERTFASPPGAGQELLPPEGFADAGPDDPVDDGFDLPDPDGNDPFADDGGPEPGEEVDAGPDAHPGDAVPDVDADPDPGDGSPGDHPAADW